MATEERLKGREYAKGVTDHLLFLLIIYVIVSFILHAIKPIDDSDASKFERSGMKIFTDHKTGKEYLASPYGSLIERPTK